MHNAPNLDRLNRPVGLYVPATVIDAANQRDEDDNHRASDRRRWRPFAVVPGAPVEAVEVVTADCGDSEVDAMLAADAVDELAVWLQD